MNRTEFDYQNGRDNVPASFLQSDEPHEAVAPTCRGYYSNGVLVPLSEGDDTLAEANGVLRGVHWEDHHAWEAERQTYLRGNRVRKYSAQQLADMVATDRKMHVHWDAGLLTAFAWPLRDWEKDAANNKTLDNWAERLKEWAEKQE